VLPGRDIAGAEGECQVGRILVLVETEATDIVLRVVGIDRADQADRHHVFRFCQRRPQRHGAVVLAVIVFRFPCLAAGFLGGNREGFVRDDRQWAEAFFQCSRIDKGFHARPWLAPCLGDVVELVTIEIEATDQRTDGAIARVGGHESRLDLRPLGNLPDAFCILIQTNDGATSHPLVRRRFLIEHA